jgi:hypothetical protein
MDQEKITVVSGLPRSGTSMMMKMLEAGGIPVVTDRLRLADEDNPQGYYELERVKQMEHDKAWLEDARGKVVKVIAALLKHLPPDYAYQIIFMRRSIDEVLASQRQMLIRRGEPTDTLTDERMGELFRRHVTQVRTWIAEQPNIQVLEVDYSEVLAHPLDQAGRINQFLGSALDVESMAEVVNPDLYRQRAPEGKHSTG